MKKKIKMTPTGLEPAKSELIVSDSTNCARLLDTVAILNYVLYI